MSRTNSAGPSRGISPAPSPYASSSFTPLPRSLLAGTGIRFSPTPPLEAEAGPSKSPRPMEGDIEPGEIKEAIVGGNIFIDEVPHHSPPLPGTAESKDESSAPKSSSDHFQPPGLFSTSLMPTLTTTQNGPSVELQKSNGGQASKGKGKGKAKEEQAESSLLLPSHVLVDSTSPSKINTDEVNGDKGDQLDNEDSMEGLYFVDDDISKGSKRYFDPEEDATREVEATFLATADQSKICQNCKRPGHRSKDCKHIICTTCGAEDAHERRDCPVGLVCFGCGGRGHRKQDCPDPASRLSRRTGCDRCGSRDHMENMCHTLWRVYTYLSNDSRAETIRDKMGVEGWEKEAIGGRPSDEWCYNCAREGHLGDDCSKRRGSLARLTVPSAFSHEMSSRGPFFTSSSRRNADLPPPTHSRFDDDQDDNEKLPFITGGYKNFGGSSAGRKTREKERARQVQLERERQRGGSDDEPSWFDNSRSGRGGLNIRGRGGGGGAYSTPTNRNGNGGRRPWDSEYRERERDQSYSARSTRQRDRSRSPPSRPDRRDDGNRNGNGKMPFSHGHLMDHGPAPSSAPAKVISFGRLSEPGQSRNNNNGAKELISRALGGGGQSTPTGKNRNGPQAKGSPLVKTPVVEIPTSSRSGRKRKPKGGNGNEDQDRDWESEWRNNGNGGGKVENWGKELDNATKANGIKIKGKSGEMNAALGGRQNVPTSVPSRPVTPTAGGKKKGRARNKGKGGDGGGNDNAKSGGGWGNKRGGGGGGGGQRYHGGYD
ncbi:hypothetical protein I302_105899 [Kwoniella bestiolae CBS 10118]|uniref:CCHC-type domain-containing protein n=1 Tax=Kwoniella bestiolae CBS 10118 TaxID=1296100 RepID=A0A1B9G2H5_9TREE|nr:hypothetical protein I302_05024 [Kwoniella bestiolae CBS 10118]OCF25211.1 hypothetical protein I302_05024 [Kwoniella bestiolae CBS 10118]